MINIHNTFDPLKEIIIGDVDIDSIKMEDPRQQKRIEYIFQKTKEEMNIFQEVLESRGIIVHRPTPMLNVPIQTPYWSMPGTKIPLTPRDLYLILGNTIVESAMCEQQRLFETFYYRDIMLEEFQKGAKWMAMPIPRHNYNDYDLDIDEDIPNQDPIMDAPSCLKYGKDVFVNTHGAGNKLGLEWLESMFGDTYTFHEVKQKNIVGHLDSQITILRPGLLTSYHDREDLPVYFKDWDIIDINPENDKKLSTSQTPIDSRIQDFDFENTVLVVNCLSIDTNTVVMWDHYKTETSMIKQFEKKNIDIVFVPFTYSHFFNQGVTCLTLDLVRHTPEGLVKYQ
jgi:N-dimethylarginine dimethylaminohydrolase